MSNGSIATAAKPNITLGEGFLQFPFSHAVNKKAAHKKSTLSVFNHESDRRIMRVSNQNEKQESGTSRLNTAPSGDAHPASDSDGLLGSMILEHFASSSLGGFFLPLLPLIFQSCDMSAIADCADSFLIDRASAKAEKEQMEYSWF